MFTTRVITIVSVAMLTIGASGCSTTPPFIVAADDGDLARVRSMLDENPALVDTRDVDNMTAAIAGAKGAAPIRVGWTALHSAANKGRKDVAGLLVARGADVNAMDEREYTPLKLAALGGYQEIAELLVANGALINPVDIMGLSPLHCAAIGGNLQIAKMLIAKGAAINAQRGDYVKGWSWVTVSGNTYTERAVSSGKFVEGRTPLHLAVTGGNREMTELLIASGSIVDMRENHGNTALHFAAANNHRNVAEVLVRKGAEINARGSNGSTPLHTAAQWGSRDMVEFLLANGAEVNAKNQTGLTPLRLAVSNKRNDVAEYLRKQGGVE
jgi:ankyrin repeat protein